MSILDKVLGARWAIVPDVLETILRVASRGPAVPKEEWPSYATRQAQGAAVAAGYRYTQVVDGVAVIGLTGPIFPRANLLTERSGASDLSSVRADFARAQRDRAVAAILLDIDSPGGVVTGIDDFAARVRGSDKPVVAFASGWAASAAYYIAAGAREIVADRGASLGSIGVRTAVTKQLQPDLNGEMTFVVVSSGAPLKIDDPESEASMQALRAELDDLEDLFVGFVAEGRRVSAETVRARFGQGGMMIAARAVAAGMADSIGTFERAVARAKEIAADGPPPILTNSPAAHGAADAGASAVAPPTAQQGEPDMSETKPQGGPAPSPAPLSVAPVSRPESEVKAEAIAAERARIKAINDLALPGNEALVARCVDDGSSAEQFAIAQTMAEKNRGAAYLDQRRQAEAALAKVAPSAATDPVPTPSGATPVPRTDEEARAAYARSAELQAEFVAEGDYVAWAAAKRGNRFKLLQGKAA